MLGWILNLLLEYYIVHANLKLKVRVHGCVRASGLIIIRHCDALMHHMHHATMHARIKGF
jgi:hypothetical protein